MVWAGYMGFPMSLKSAGAALGLDEQKMEEGGELITYFCKPYRATARNGYGNRNLPQHALEKWELFKAYNQLDVDVEMTIEEKLKAHPVPAQIWKEYVLDQEINDRGIAIDATMVKKAIELDEQSAFHLREEMQRITRLENPQSVIQMQKWLKENGVELESLGKKELAKEIAGIEEPIADSFVAPAAVGNVSSKKIQGDGERSLLGWPSARNVQVLRSEQVRAIQLRNNTIAESLSQQSSRLGRSTFASEGRKL